MVGTIGGIVMALVMNNGGGAGITPKSTSKLAT